MNQYTQQHASITDGTMLTTMTLVSEKPVVTRARVIIVTSISIHMMTVSYHSTAPTATVKY